MRIDYFSHLPEFITPLRQLTRQQHDLTLPAPLRALLELRVSQLNGCVYCVALHTKEARQLAVPAAQLDHLPVWQEVTRVQCGGKGCTGLGGGADPAG